MKTMSWRMLWNQKISFVSVHSNSQENARPVFGPGRSPTFHLEVRRGCLHCQYSYH
jgi:hypothetical protein